ncbi:homeodomain transcription factor ste12 [Phlyctochytrium planicorne]|nr:homeodomain transcription factor ste12 [Phlyctochytrium planicorne]
MSSLTHPDQQPPQQTSSFLMAGMPPSPPLSNTDNHSSAQPSTSLIAPGAAHGLGISHELSNPIHPTPPEKHMDPSQPISHNDMLSFPTQHQLHQEEEQRQHASSETQPDQHDPNGYGSSFNSNGNGAHSDNETSNTGVAQGSLQVGEPNGTLQDQEPVTAAAVAAAAAARNSAAIFSNASTLEVLENLKLFLATAPSTWDPEQVIKHFTLPNGENVSCVLWSNLFHITGTDIVRSLTFRFAAFGRPVKNMKKFEEGVFSDLRNLKPGIDATLEDPRSEFLEFLFKANCIRTQKKQKVFYWFSVPHDRLFMDALERDLKRESLGIEPTTVAINPLPLAATIELAKQQCLLQLPKQGSEWVPDYLPDSGNGANGQQMAPQMINQLGRTDSFDDKGGVSYPGSLANSPALSHAQIGSLVGSPAPTQQNVDGSGQGEEFQLAAGAGNGMFNPVFSLFEGSPNYKQRRRAQSLLSNGKGRAGSVPTEVAAGTGGGFLMAGPSPSPSGSPAPSDNDARVHTCTFDNCGKKFKRFEHLRRHMRCHTGERPYQCPLESCGKVFSRSDNLACHMKVHGFTPEQIAASRSPTPNLHAPNNNQSRHHTPASMGSMSESPEMGHLHPPAQHHNALQQHHGFQDHHPGQQDPNGHNGFVGYPNGNVDNFGNPMFQNQHPHHHPNQSQQQQQYGQVPNGGNNPNLRMQQGLPSLMVFPPTSANSKQPLPSLLVPNGYPHHQMAPPPQPQSQQQSHPYNGAQATSTAAAAAAAAAVAGLMMPPPQGPPHQQHAQHHGGPWAPNAGADVSFTLPPLTPSGLSPYLNTTHSGAYPLGMPTVF